MGYFNFEEAKARFSNIQIGGVDYFLPNALEQATALGAQTSHPVGFIQSVYPFVYTRNLEAASLYDTQVRTQAIYRILDEKTAYAIRHTWGTNEFRSAYRYRFVLDDANRHTNHLEVSVLHLGPDFTGSITDVVAKPESDWTTSGIIKKFPLTGYYGGTSPADKFERVLLWSTKESGDGHAGYFFEAIWRTSSPSSSPKKLTADHSSVKSNKMTVRLFKKNL